MFISLSPFKITGPVFKKKILIFEFFYLSQQTITPRFFVYLFQLENSFLTIIRPSQRNFSLFDRDNNELQNNTPPSNYKGISQIEHFDSRLRTLAKTCLVIHTSQIDKIRDSVEERQSRIAWQTINEVSRRKNTAKAKLKAANQQERIKLWKQHFENLLGNPPKITHEPITRIISKQLDIKLGPFTQEELDSVLRKIKNRKAAGLDEIPPEVWKTRQFDDILLRHCNAVYNQNPIDR